MFLRMHSSIVVTPIELVAPVIASLFIEYCCISSLCADFLHHFNDAAPSTVNVAPETYDASSETRNKAALAISIG